MLLNHLPQNTGFLVTGLNYHMLCFSVSRSNREFQSKGWLAGSRPPIHLLHCIKSILYYEEEGPDSYE